MDAKEFDAALARVLGVCRAAAVLELPIKAMLEHVADGFEAALTTGTEWPRTEEATRTRQTPDAVVELEALREIIAAVGEVAAIGAKLPSVSPKPPQTIPPEPDFPMPANLRQPYVAPEPPVHLRPDAAVRGSWEQG